MRVSGSGFMVLRCKPLNSKPFKLQTCTARKPARAILWGTRVCQQISASAENSRNPQNPKPPKPLPTLYPPRPANPPSFLPPSSPLLRLWWPFLYPPLCRQSHDRVSSLQLSGPCPTPPAKARRDSSLALLVFVNKLQPKPKTQNPKP